MTHEGSKAARERAERAKGEKHWQDASEKHNVSNNAQRAFLAWDLLKQDTNLLAVPETDTIYACHEGVWRDDGEQVLRERASRLMGASYSTSLYRELRERVLADAGVPRTKLGVLDGTIAVENGLLNLRDRALEDLHPEDYALYRLPVAYDSEADCPEWKSFLEDVTDGEAVYQLQEFVGYCIAGGQPWLKKALMILGPTDAGKTVFLEVVEALFGKEANAGQTPQYLANQRWGLHQLAGKPVNIRHDIDADRIQKLGILKEVIDGNPITAEQKGKDPYTLHPETRLLFAANRAPKRVRDDEAFWNRWLTVIFPESVPPEEQVDKQELLTKLTDELPGILNWALDGLDRLRQRGCFTAEPSPEEVRRRWEQYGSPIERFKTSCLVKDPDEAVPKERVREEFTMFCLENRYEDLTDQELTKELTQDPRIGESQRRIGNERPRVYTGIRLAENVSEQEKMTEVIIEDSEAYEQG